MINKSISTTKKIHWVKAFDNSENEIKEYLYDLFSVLSSISEEAFSKMEEEIINLYESNKEYMVEDFNCESFDNSQNEIMSSFDKQLLDIRTELISVINQASSKISNDVKVNSLVTEKDFGKVKRRMLLTQSNLNAQVNSFWQETLVNIKESSKLIGEHLDEIIKSKSISDKDLVTEDETINKTKYKKIFDYKKIIKIAEDNGYAKKSSRGCRIIYAHSKTNKIVVIPARTLGLGLSIKLQKDIYKGAC